MTDIQGAQDLLAFLKKNKAETELRDKEVNSVISTLKAITDKLPGISTPDIIRSQISVLQTLQDESKEGNNIQERQSAVQAIIAEIETYLNALNNTGSTRDVIEYIVGERTALYRSEVKNTIDEANKEVNNLRAETARLKTESDRFSKFIQDREVLTNNKDFRTQASLNKTLAITFLVLSIFSISAFICFIYESSKESSELADIANNISSKAILFNKNNIKENIKWDNSVTTKLIYAEITKKIGSRILIYSLVIYTITILIKNFTAQMHNFTVNSNIANAFESVRSLVGTSKTRAGNDAMLSQMTQALFASQKSGYSGKDGDISPPNIVANVIDLAKNAKG